MSSLTAENMDAGIQRGAFCQWTEWGCMLTSWAGFLPSAHAKIMSATRPLHPRGCQRNASIYWLQLQLSRSLLKTTLSIIRGDSVQHMHRWKKQRKSAHRI
jgi:hypothetical protein